MKNIQTGILKILALLATTFFALTASAQKPDAQLAQADSLFKAKQYTQSLDIYEELLLAKQYSPAMLLKMAFIQEGLGVTSLGLYYLNLYYLATGDEQTLAKMQELAAKNRLEGYQNPEADRFYYYVNKYGYLVSLLFASFMVFALAWIYFQKQRNKKPKGAVALLVVFMLLLTANVNFPLKDSTVIITSGNTYLMNGPSAGANVVGIVNEGNKLRLLAKQDVWLKVQWFDQPVYVKENRVASITL